ncbi:hypothetical protein [Argonema antarcticum]|uniref:hypothetical protein n=1 Tax=Argonema antarcticum TaxID=2942763 RepID=UPI0020111BBC|nr:hypothetical protein [Argonema antarcticum]MCL1469804.1 hypothetical protein [Argonema antarcticum A004/B2]
MSHFNFKSLAFYGTAIGSVVILFKIVTVYGQNLKAPFPIDGRYRITAQNLPECLQSDDLILNIQQSGIYLNGSLLALSKNVEMPNSASTSETIVQPKPSLVGRWKNQQLTLSGSVNKLSSCNNKVNLSIQANVNQQTMNGQMTLNSTTQPVKFTAQRESNEQQQKKQASH